MHLTKENMISSHRDFWARIVRYIRKTKVEDIPKTDGVSRLRIKKILQEINLTPSELTLFSISKIKCKVATEEEALLTSRCYPCDYFGIGNCKICSQVLDLNCNIYGSAWHNLVHCTKTKKDLLKYAIQIRDCKEYSC